MSIEQWSEDVILVKLAAEPEMGDELSRLVETVRDKQQNVAIDFSEVDIIEDGSLVKLLRVRSLVIENENKLILCSMRQPTKRIFIVTGLNAIFEFADDRFVALATIEMTKS